MLLIIIKVLALLLSGLVIAKSYLAYRQRQESLVMFLFWTVTWLLILTIAFYPELITVVIGERKVGVGSFLGVALVFVYFVVYRIYVKADRIEKKLQQMTRQLALKEMDKKPKAAVKLKKRKKV